MDASVLWIGKTEYCEQLGIKRHVHEYEQLFFVTSGQGVFYVDNMEYAIKECDCIFVNAGRVHCLYKSHECTLKMLDIKFAVHNTELYEQLLRLPVKLPGSIAMRMLLEQIKSEGEQKKLYYKQIAQNLLQQLLYLLLRNQTVVKAEADAIEKKADEDLSPITNTIQKYIQEYYAQNLPLDIISEKLCYSKIYLCAAFKKDTGMTINEYIYRTRVMKACEMIRYSDFALEQVCLMTGFKNIHHFSRKFKDIVGLSPGRYRRKQGGIQICIDERFVNVDNFDGWKL